ncbi:MAG: hypothetical protein WDW36_002642 [Sanguina aurantia]
MRILYSLLAVLLVTSASAQIRLQQVDRKINLSTHLVRSTETIKVKNTGDQALDQVTLCSLSIQDAHTAYRKVDPISEPSAPEGVSCVSVTLRTKLAAGESTTLISAVVFHSLQNALPAEISQGEAQLMLYLDNLYVLSPYTIVSQTTEVILPSSNVKSFTQEKPSSKSDSKIKYGKYDLVKPFSIKELRVHFENMKAFKTVTTLVREIEVSHWGNIYVEEHYELKHSGAKHKGAFSRLKYMHNYNGRGNSFREVRAVLPASAHSMYYVDLIGNISSSNVRKSPTETVLDFEPRYPLVGGWKVDFRIGYSVPLEGFLFGKPSDGKRRLTMALSTPLEDVHVEQMEVRIVLPEGSSAINTILPYEMEQSADVKFTYLDVTGRPVVVLRKSHLVPEHAATFDVDYSFATISLLREPLLLITVFLALLAAVIVYNRLEFTLSRDEKWAAGQAQEHLATLMEQVQAIMEDEKDAIARLAKVASSVTQAADVEPAARARAEIEASLKALESKMRPLSASVEACCPKAGAQLKALAERLKALQAQSIKLAVDRCEQAKKATTSEWVLKTNPVVKQLKQAMVEMDKEVEVLFAAY